MRCCHCCGRTPPRAQTGERAGIKGAPSPCRVPARRPGNFLLLAQKKVTKEECLNAKPLSSIGALRMPGPAGDLTARGRSLQQPARTLRARCASPLAFKGCGVRIQTRCMALASSFSGSAGQWCSGSAVQRCSGLATALWVCGASESSNHRASERCSPGASPGDAKRAVKYERAGGAMCRSASGHPLGRAGVARRTS
jgi:hypothetical protein